MTKLKDNDPRPPYVQIADDFRASIKAGKLKPGDRIKPARQLAEDYEVAMMTVSQAIRLLKADGLVVSWTGRGVFVAQPGDAIEPDETSGLAERLDTVLEEVRDLGQRVAALEAAREHQTSKR